MWIEAGTMCPDFLPRALRLKTEAMSCGTASAARTSTIP
jgi:hypothetical protein